MLLPAETPQTVLYGLGIIALLAIGRFFIRLYQVRSSIRDVTNKYGVPILPHSFLFGHLPIVIKVMAAYPSDIYGHYLPLLIEKEYPDICKSRGVMYIDSWPLANPMLAVYDPGLMNQFTTENSRPKHELVRDGFYILGQGLDIFVSEGQQWKEWRKIFNPGFSLQNLMSFVPAIVDEIEVFRGWLKDVAESGNVVELEEQTERLTTDVIGLLALNTRLHSQTTSSTFYNAMKKQAGWFPYDNQPSALFTRTLNPFRPLAVWMNNWTMRSCLMPHIRKALAQEKEESLKTLLNLAIQSKERGSSDGPPTSQFIDIVVSQLKTFMFGGHETTAATLCLLYYLVYTNTAALDALRREHDEVLGSDPAMATELIKKSPALLNRLPYTTAVIRETVRLFPPVGTVRAGSPDFFLTDPTTGDRYPTNGMMVFGCSAVVHRKEAFWPEPHKFMPERWLVPEGHALHPPRSAFRAFEHGPRNCIGQELAQLELRAILAMTVRDFDIQPQFPADAFHPGRLRRDLGTTCP
ncbi:hypothetical protein UA08_08623 [Talaromyces atroroseus]|uniref:Sterigmatocystin biosynthesis P450 monooxygenase stcS n=1 Tax=Talaromyces atroroseus TaxID=1441469 RepID=A0A225ANR1_TALAT|nr:hypothetical protein UA08_08623 [Talaromyces atroroseus]OKL56065.1 hypothetical protein UA08_08623 [Talaromyces atroroseus]